MLLERWAREIFHGIVGTAASVLNRTGDILNVIVDLLLVCGSGSGAGPDQVDERLNALNE